MPQLPDLDKRSNRDQQQPAEWQNPFADPLQPGETKSTALSLLQEPSQESHTSPDSRMKNGLAEPEARKSQHPPGQPRNEVSMGEDYTWLEDPFFGWPEPDRDLGHPVG